MMRCCKRRSGPKSRGRLRTLACSLPSGAREVGRGRHLLSAKRRRRRRRGPLRWAVRRSQGAPFVCDSRQARRSPAAATNLVARALPVPSPIGKPDVLGEGIATVESFLGGEGEDGHDPRVRRSLAIDLWRLVDASRTRSNSTRSVRQPCCDRETGPYGRHRISSAETSRQRQRVPNGSTS
jgi:hypothetical protein